MEKVDRARLARPAPQLLIYGPEKQYQGLQLGRTESQACAAGPPARQGARAVCLGVCRGDEGHPPSSLLSASAPHPPHSVRCGPAAAAVGTG